MEIICYTSVRETKAKRPQTLFSKFNPTKGNTKNVYYWSLMCEEIFQTGDVFKFRRVLDFFKERITIRHMLH